MNTSGNIFPIHISNLNIHLNINDQDAAPAGCAGPADPVVISVFFLHVSLMDLICVSAIIFVSISLNPTLFPS